MASSFLRFPDHTQRRITVGRTPLDEWSARRRDLYLATHNTHNRQTSMHPVGFEPTISAVERPQTYALDRVVTRTGQDIHVSSLIIYELIICFGISVWSEWERDNTFRLTLLSRSRSLWLWQSISMTLTVDLYDSDSRSLWLWQSISMTLTRWFAITAKYSRLLPLLQAKESLKATVDSLYSVPSECLLRILKRTELLGGQSNLV